MKSAIRDRLNASYRESGWGRITDQALGVEPYDVESQARRVAEWAHLTMSGLEAKLVSLQQFKTQAEQQQPIGVLDLSGPLLSVRLDARCGYGTSLPDGTRFYLAAGAEPLTNAQEDRPAASQAEQGEAELPTPRIEIFEYRGYNGGFATKRVLLHRCELIGANGERRHSRSDSWHGYSTKEHCTKDANEWSAFTGWLVFDLGRLESRDDPIKDTG